MSRILPTENLSPEIARALDRHVHRSVRSVAGGLALGLGIFCFVDFFRLPSSALVKGLLVNGLSSILFGLVWYALKRNFVPSRFANPLGLGLFLLATSNVLFTFFLIENLVQTNFLVIFIIGAGSTFLRAGWLFLYIAITVGAWIPLTRSMSVPPDDVVHFLGTLLGGTVLALIIQQARFHTYVHLKRVLLDAEAEVEARRQAEENARESKERYRLLFEETRDAMELAQEHERERRRFEERTQHAKRLESLGVLGGGIAHDFNNLLVGIMSNAGLALQELPRESPVRSLIEDIEQSGQRAADLADQLLAYAGKGQFDLQVMELGAVIKETAKLVGASIASNAELFLDIQLGLPPVKGDSIQLRQVIMNLIVNASDALAGSPGKISVCLRRHGPRKSVPASPYIRETPEDGDFLVLRVKDTGCGMDEETRLKIFDPFFTTKVMGRGLGMSAVLGIVKSHGGTLTLDSELGKGSELSIYLPVSRERLEESTGEPMTVSKWKGAGRVLVVDDEEMVRRTLERSLQSIGFDVDAATGGQEAVEIFSTSSESFVAVILDLTMPGMDGDATLAELRKIDPQVTAVVVSGFDEREIADRFQDQPPAGVLKKPFRPRDLRQKMHSILA